VKLISPGEEARMLELVGKEVVTELMASDDPDAALVYRRGSCVVSSAGEADGVVIARRRDIAAESGQLSDEELEKLAVTLDNVARDLGT
jgi:hypothetical protein